MSGASGGTLHASCAWAACKQPATTRAGEWDFCAFHAEQDRAMQQGDEHEPEDVPDEFLAPEATGHGTAARYRQHLREGTPACVACTNAQARDHQDNAQRRRGNLMSTPTTAAPVSLLERASASRSPKVKKLGQRIEGLMADLRAALDEAEVEDAARAKIERLERELAEEKAKLRKKPAAASSGERKGWTPEARAAASERMRARNLAKQQAQAS